MEDVYVEFCLKTYAMSIRKGIVIILLMTKLHIDNGKASDNGDGGKTLNT